MSNSNSSIFKDNTFIDNTYHGIKLLLGSSLNLIYNNEFIDNNGGGIQAYDNGTNNQWDNGAIGNYWSDYSGADANDDGIGDTPYNITGVAGSADRYPIWDDGPEPAEKISFGDYYLVFLVIGTISLIIVKKRKILSSKD